MMERVQRVLEYDKMKQQLLSFVASSLGRRKVEALIPSRQIDEVIEWQRETAEAVDVLRLKGAVPLGGITDIGAHVKRAQIGGGLSATELTEIAATLYGGKRTKQFFTNIIADELLSLPLLGAYVEQIVPLTPLEQAIKQCIDDHGYVLDQASGTLRTVRAQIRTFETTIRTKLEQFTRSSRSMLSDALVTIRNDRYVIPVKQEYRSSFGGIVHDQSASGATLFIEPGVIVSLNNQLTEAKSREKREIERILADLSNQVGVEGASLLLNLEMLAQIDFVVAKAQYANAIRAVQPKLNDQGYIHLKQARHPLLSADEVVPIEVAIGNDIRSLVITGPNTGGKTVTLKTIGLLSCMAQSGLHVPAEEETELAVFAHIFADIGDEQSIEQSLSTFSSHMKNIVSILEQVNEQSLVLLDELGAGTDPTEGAALAMAILDHLYGLGALAVATTHYSELKGYAYERTGALNASVEFDVETLRPTYRLLVGVPGRSNAFAISKRLGLNEGIITAAKVEMTREAGQVERMIASLEQRQKEVEQAREEALAVQQDAETLKKQLAREFARFEREKQLRLQEVDKKAAQALTEAKEEAEMIIAELRDLQKQGTAVKDHQLIEARKHLEEAAPKLSQQKPTSKGQMEKMTERAPQPGDEVKVLSLNQNGSIVKKVDDKTFLVQLGMMKMSVATDDMQLLKSSKKETNTASTTSLKRTNMHVSPELDLRGERYEEAMRRVEKYIDDALLAGYSKVSIIHGHGTGALRKGVKKLVAAHPRIKTTRDGGMNEGGLGNTVIEFM
ncbi:DNA mismatch repair protein MutS2 [Shouchella lonarensis]|uniref:Endonuclease MutS2 n=2 Tax=Shouchella lonarensis TaxID=1464122 RepID=A0A1G6K3Z9_9BACI|nr:DNA mismatch repair protein MutS2 [Shouchella lonarensis]